MEGEPLRHDGIIASLDEGNEARFERPLFLAGEVYGVAGPAQQDLHPARPVLLVDVDECLQFAQMMRVAQRMTYAPHGVVGLPVVMHRNTDHVVPDGPALGTDPVDGQPGGGGDVQPSGSAADAKAGLVQMLDLGTDHMIARDVEEAL